MQIDPRKASGNLDPDFGNAGLAVIPGHLSQIHPQPLDDQRILSVAAEHAGNVVTLIRHLDNGEIDTSYGNQGTSRITLPVGPDLGGIKHQLLPDGRCLVFGSVGSMLESTGFVMRVLANGELDTSFGQSGFYILKLGISTYIRGLGVLSDGKVLIRISTDRGAFFDYYLARLDNGHLDPTYGEKGAGMVHVGHDLVDDLLVLPGDAALIAASPSGFSKTIFKQFDANGRPDATFADAGVFELSLEQGGLLAVLQLLRQPDGKIVAVGGADVGFGIHFLITRLNPEGSMDSTFNNGEPKIMVLQGYEAQAEAVALQTDSKLVVMGTTAHIVTGPENFVLMRFLPNAMLDSSFGDNGQVMTDFGGRDIANHMKLQADGKILVAGSTSTIETLTGGTLLVRYLG